MPSDRERMEAMSDAEVSNQLSFPAGTPAHGMAVAEIQRRKMITDRDSIEAQQTAAKAALESAKYAHLSAYCAVAAILISLIAIVISILHK